MSEVHNDYDRAPWIKMPLSELITPKPGRICVGARWWAVTDDGCVLFWRSHRSPQCNAVREVVERIRPDLTPQFVEMAFVPHRCSDYV